MEKAKETKARAQKEVLELGQEVEELRMHCHEDNDTIAELRSSLNHKEQEIVEKIARDFEESSDVHPIWSADAIVDRIRDFSPKVTGDTKP